MSLIIRQQTLLHEGGTKFYEVTEFALEGTSKVGHVTRWGPMSAQDSGGQQQFTAEERAAVIIKKKQRRGYTTSTSEKVTRCTLKEFLKGGTFPTSIKNFDRQSLNELELYFTGIGDIEDPYDPPVFKPKAKKEPEVVRDENWGSW